MSTMRNKRRIWLISSLSCLLHILFSQEVKNVDARAVEDKIEISCELAVPADVLVNLQAYYSEDNGNTFYPCKTVTGDLENQLSGKNYILWDCGKDGIIMGNFIFKIEWQLAEKIKTDSDSLSENHIKEQPSLVVPVDSELKKKDGLKGSFLVMPGASLGNVTSLSCMVGYVKRIGGYAKVKLSTTSKEDAIKGNEEDAFFDGETVKGRFSIGAGIIGRVSKVVYLYGGVGYGNQWVQWKTLGEKYIKIEDLTYNGVDPEAGLILKFGVFSIGGGVNCLIGKGNTQCEGNISIGVMF